MRYRSALMAIMVLSILASTLLFFIPFKHAVHIPESRRACPLTEPVHCDAIWIITAHDESVVTRNSLWWSPLVLTGVCTAILIYRKPTKTNRFGSTKK